MATAVIVAAALSGLAALAVKTVRAASPKDPTGPLLPPATHTR